MVTIASFTMVAAVALDRPGARTVRPCYVKLLGRRCQAIPCTAEMPVFLKQQPVISLSLAVQADTFLARSNQPDSVHVGVYLSVNYKRAYINKGQKTSLN